MASRERITSAFAPDLGELRAWLEKMIAALRFMDLVTAIVALFGRMSDINLELAKQLAYLRRRRPRSESLELFWLLRSSGRIITPHAGHHDGGH